MAPDRSGEAPADELSQIDPHAFLFPLFTRRPPNYQEQVNVSQSTLVERSWTNLAARLDRLLGPQHQNSRLLSEAINDVLGFNVGTVASVNGKLVGVWAGETGTVELTRMGAGVANVVTLLHCLVNARGKVFLIEEPETDLHPAALRKLLRYIVEAGAQNQFSRFNALAHRRAVSRCGKRQQSISCGE